MLDKIKRSLVSDNLMGVLKERGIGYVIKGTMRMAFNWSINYYYYKLFKSGRTFVYNGKTFPYFNHRYHETLRNERTLEIPIAWDIVSQYKGKEILEIGNVLSHYYPVNYDVLDKYEKAPGVMNQDVVEFTSTKKYDLIIAISTFEHVGWDEPVRDATKIKRSLENLKKYLTPNGKLACTMPLGHNAYLDEQLDKKELPFTETHFMKRISGDNLWKESPWSDVKGSRYDSPYPCANAIVVAVLENK